MRSSMPSAVREAREALGLRLREIRIDAGLSARDLGRKMGRHPSKISRIEHGRAAPSVADITAWCAHCRTPSEEADLVASLRAAEGMYIEWQRREQSGMRQVQESYSALEEQTQLFRIYEAGWIPGLLQTPEYAMELMGRIIDFCGIPDDLDEAVAARVNRQRILQQGNHRFLFVLEEWALWSRVGGAKMMAGQLGHLINVASWPSISLGIIPRTIERTMWQSPGFWIFDEEKVIVETPTAQLTITQPREISIYLRTFAEFTSMAVYGPAARTLMTTAIDALGEADDQ